MCEKESSTDSFSLRVGRQDVYPHLVLNMLKNLRPILQLYSILTVKNFQVFNLKETQSNLRFDVDQV